MSKAEAAQSSQAATQEEVSPLDNLLSKIDIDRTQDEERANDLSLAMNLLIDSVTRRHAKVERVDKVLIDQVIAELDSKISAQVNEVLHNEEFQKLESAWRGLKHVVDRTNFRRNIKIEVINVSKDELESDFQSVPETLQSGLFKHVYDQEYDQAGGEPFGAIIGNYEFANTVQDITLLLNLAKVSAACHAPFIGSVGSRFFGVKDMEELSLKSDVGPIFEQKEYVKWNTFRETEDSRYVGLTMPRFLLRTPYGPDTVPTKTFHFEEDASGETHEKYLWGNASFAFAANLSRSFAENGWCVNIRGPKAGGLVEDLPVHFYEASGGTQTKIPTEVLISDRREFELSELGFIPLAFYKSKDYACFFSANSIQKPAEYIGKDADYATANSRLSSRLPYLFLVSRLAHYLKVIQRENIGASKEKDELQRELYEWINTLVTEMKDPGPELKAKHPLSQAQIEVLDIADNPGFYKVGMKVRPHFQIEGIDVNLSLVSRLPKDKKS